MIIVMFGAPGVGKGTIADMLVEKHKLEIISASGLLKKEVKKKTKTGKEIADLMSKGKLVSSEIILPLIIKAIKSSKAKKIILDGFPRNIEQAKLIEGKVKIDVVLDMKAPEKIIIQRLSGRRVCPKCGTIYHLINLPPKKKNICDKDKEKLLHRNDDQPKVIKERLKVYKKETLPLEKFFAKQKLIKEIDSSDNPKSILKRTEKALGLK